jgi:hypothetical protein
MGSIHTIPVTDEVPVADPLPKDVDIFEVKRQEFFKGNK